ncbi:hypothetical protein GYMLUDRAFT_58091 [Collybiopsis luxurians FD-317 M1]|uniref:Yeast cell wall synthesis Kre9/Knh1-like N-terminal domain-containing protein n=1 Tax=Collybiopsis luxurians FD-317 M1 TaxID=944289 RepID=A0A0D0CTQ5_9AGAR|nr:hypothetical protein GYMLUDRAFT_58091 [Collybiopsis luxurians FD-317 M1]
MQFTLSIASALVAALAASASPVSLKPAVAAARAMLDVWAPTIISPDASTVWTQGKQYNVTWDTSDAPANISNGASVVLGNNTQLTDRVLAQGFDLRQGWVTVTCPSDIFPTNTYSIILFGDSGDQSKQFSIVSADGSDGASDGDDSDEDESSAVPSLL